MHENRDACLRAVQSRDRRFDGQFITAVTTTRIYCRPSCPARTPHPDNMVFHPTAASAHNAGFRACKRCHPDSAPGAPEWDIRADAVARAVRLIHDGVVDRGGITDIAGRLGYSVRHLQRLFADELGVGPLDVARAHRARTARLLLQNTTMTVADIAHAAGFASIRACNETIQAVYAATPTQLRHTTNQPTTDNTTTHITLQLPVREPFDPSNLFGHLIACAIPGIETWVDGTYWRTLRLPHGPALLGLSPGTNHITTQLRLADIRDVTPAIARAKHLTDADADPTAVLDTLGTDPALGPHLHAHPGRRIPRTVDGTELTLRTIIGQQISTTAGRTVAATMVTALGDPFPSPIPGITHLFPTADAIADAADHHLTMPTTRKNTLRRVAAAIATGDVSPTPDADRADLAAALGAIKGVGPWTVNTVLMRALADPDVFLPTDLGILTASRELGIADTAAQLARHAEAWAPWRSYAVQYLWATGDHPINTIPDAAAPTNSTANKPAKKLSTKTASLKKAHSAPKAC